MILERGAIFAEKYEILEVLSSGAQASVYKALQKSLDRVVILKVLTPALTANPEIVARFEREAKLLSTIKEENVTKIYDYGKHNGVYFFVSEYIEGISVKELIERKGRLSSQFASYIILESAKTLARLHQQGIIHRDIKPGNILLSQDREIKLTDFGLAFSQALPSLTIEGSILGTPAYMPPEQIIGKPADNRSDIYSLGVVFYELLIGTNPFLSETYSAIMHNVLNVKLTPVYKMDPSLEETKDLWQIIERMIKKSSQERFENISEVCVKLETWFNKEINKSWKLDLSDLLAEAKQPALRLIHKSKPILRMVAYVVAIVILFTTALVIAVNKTKKPKQIQTPVAVNLIDSTLTPKRGSSLIGKPDTSKTESIIIDQMTPLDLQKSIRQNIFGHIKIQVLPWATVYIDGKEIFTTPKDTLIQLSSGQHNIKLINPSFPVIESIIMVGVQENVTLVCDLTERVSYLQISVQPWADIYIDDIFEATTPIVSPLILSAGAHKITVKNPYFQPFEETIEFKPKQTLERNIVLK